MRSDPAFVNFVDRQRIEIIPAFSTAPNDSHQIRLLQDLKMLHHRAAIEVREMRANRSGCERLVTQIVEDLAPNRCGKSLEHTVMRIAD